MIKIEAYILIKEKGGEEQMCFFRKDKWDFTADKKISAALSTDREVLLPPPGQGVYGKFILFFLLRVGPPQRGDLCSLTSQKLLL